MTTETPEVRAEAGRAARKRVPPETHAALDTADRPGPVRVLGDQIPTRVPELVPLRHERMAASPFPFFRGAAAIMAADLARTPVSGLDAQLCGDAHLSNFGAFASPERSLLFDINDFDETFPGPWEWDLKRLTASLVIAGRENAFTGEQTRRIVVQAVQRYRDAMTEFATMGNLALWYIRIDVAEFKQLLGSQLDQKMVKRVDSQIAKAKSRDHLRSLAKLTEVRDGRRRIISDPPLVVPLADLTAGQDPAEVENSLKELVLEYSTSLDPGHRELVRSYTYEDMARKVVGVGSVGTRCWIMLMRGRDAEDPLFLQVKEAQPSVLEAHLGTPQPRHQGERVVIGQRIMQAAGDVFLGWQRTVGLDGQTRDFYVRQLHDWKGSASVETMKPKAMRAYAELCAWTLARAHARSGDRIAIAAYLGDDDAFPHAMADFSEAYADLNEADHATFAAAVSSGEMDKITPGG